MSEAASSQSSASIGVVVIGRNEGQRLRSCLESVTGKAALVVYVDSGSSDDSVSLARSLGADVVELDMNTPFTAARARNAGVARLSGAGIDFGFIQVVDGDCEIADQWLPHALETMKGNPKCAVACGRRRERFPAASVYNRLCDMEWDTPIGEAESCGGDALIRREAFQQVGGYDETIIAGEEPEMCFRMRVAGWKVVRLDCEMTRHDAQMNRFGQWWKRNLRSGHAYAEGRMMHGGSPERYCVDQVRSIIEWAVLLPVIVFGLAWFTWGASFLLLGLYVVQWYRIRRHRLDHGDSVIDAGLYASYCLMGKFAQFQGMVRFWWNRFRGRRGRIIEYKGDDASASGTTSHAPGAANS